MKQETLKKAIELRKEIDKLDSILFYLGCTWRAKLTSKTPKLLLGNIAYGAFKSIEIECDRELTERIQELVTNYRAEKEKEYENL